MSPGQSAGLQESHFCNMIYDFITWLILIAHEFGHKQVFGFLVDQFKLCLKARPHLTRSSAVHQWSLTSFIQRWNNEVSTCIVSLFRKRHLTSVNQVKPIRYRGLIYNRISRLQVRHGLFRQMWQGECLRFGYVGSTLDTKSPYCLVWHSAWYVCYVIMSLLF